jgi:Ig-fold domain
VRAEVTGDARLVDATGTLVATAAGGSISTRLDAIATDVFLLDVGPASRCAMTRAADFAPLLDLGPARVEVELFSDNVIDLLPGEARTIELEGPAGELRVEGWNVRG